MGNGYNHHLRHQNLQHRGTFLPMLCSRTWIKDVHLPKWQRRSASSGEPSSPRVGCIGQIKRNNKVTAYTKTNHNNPKNLLHSKSNISTTTSGGTSCRTEMTITSARRPNFNDHFHNYVPVDIVDMDPPLPVVKRVQPPSDEASLWKRRSGGMALKGLQIHTPNVHHLQPPTL